MNLEHQLNALKHMQPLSPREEAVSQTLEAARDAWFQGLPLCSGWEFLWSQLLQLRKRWWAMQGALLLLAALVLPRLSRYDQQVRSAGIIGCLFVIFLIPELWRNKGSDATQVEAACLYSLRQIYAARFTLCGIVDVFLLTLFCWELHTRLGMDILTLMRQLLLPVTVTAGICFQALSSRHSPGSSVCLVLCLCWCVLWWGIAASRSLYLHLVPGLWVVIFLFALAFLLSAVRRTLRTTNQYWEVSVS